ncbi:MAG: type II secretion system major pseudopilin GspG [Nitrospirae bacterium]|nr:type II secretion system major pseudopilin GspG [Nitrospirota bacterium]
MGNISKQRSGKAKGFTLLELMVVMVILGLLGAIVLPRFMGKIGQAKNKAAATQISYFEIALDSFYLDVGRYPSTSEGLSSLITAPGGIPEWNGPYLKKAEVPSDPWKNPYHYISPGSHGDYDIYSYGADATEGGEGDNADIVSWKAN